MIIKYKANITVVDGSDAVVALTDYFELYIVKGTPTLTSAWSIITSGPTSDGMTCMFHWKAMPDFNGQTVMILGSVVPPTLSETEFLAVAVYTDSAWSVSIMPDLHQSGGGGSIGGPQIGIDDYITNSHIKTSAAIVYSKLDLASSILNADISSAAAIVFTKMAALSANKAIVTGASGFAEASATTTKTEIGYINGLTSAVQTQLNAKLESGDIDNATIPVGAAIAWTKLAAGTVNRVMVAGAGGYPETSVITTTKLGYLSDVTSAIQAQLALKAPLALAQGRMNVGSGAGEAAPIDFGGNAKIPIGNGTTVAPQTITGDWTITNVGVNTIGANKISPSKLTSEARKEIVTIQIQTVTVGTGIGIYIPFACELVSIHTSLLSVHVTDDILINFNNDSNINMIGSALSSGDLTIPFSGASIGDSALTTVTSNNVFAATEYLYIDTKKSTPGTGEVLVVLEFERTN